MTIISDDEELMIDVGTSDTLWALYSTAYVLLNDKANELELGLNFLKTGNCSAELTGETAKQITFMKNELSSYSPDQAVYDCRNIKLQAPWKDNISTDVTSCANLFTTADGKDLLDELTDVLKYAATKSISVETLG